MTIFVYHRIGPEITVVVGGRYLYELSESGIFHQSYYDSDGSRRGSRTGYILDYHFEWLIEPMLIVAGTFKSSGDQVATIPGIFSHSTPGRVGGAQDTHGSR